MSWRSDYWYKGYLFLLAPAVVFTAQVNQAVFTYPLHQLSFDSVVVGAYTDVLEGMTVLFGSTPGGDELGRTRIRKAPTSSVLYIGWASIGTRDGEANLNDNAYITVLDDYRAWAKIPRILKNGTLYKDYDLAYSVGYPSPPVANGGPGVCKLVNGSGEISVNFDGSNSFATGTSSATITTYAWDFADGTPASASTATVNGVIFPYGFRWVHLTVTDSNGKSHTTHIPVAAIGEDYQTISYSGATITSSSEESASYLDDYAWDGNTGTRWLTSFGSNTGWTKIQLAAAETILHWTLDQTLMGTAAATAVTLEGSNNDSDWITLDTRTGLAGADTTYSWDVTNPGSYLYYRVNVTSAGVYAGAREIGLQEASTNYISDFEITEQTLTQGGQTFNVTIHQDIPASTYPDGTLVMYMEREFFDGVEGILAGPSDRGHMKFIGWIGTEPTRIEGTLKGVVSEVELHCQDIGARMRNLPAFSQWVARIGTPTSWAQLASAHTDRYVHYLGHWHSTIFEVAPFSWSGTEGTYALPWFASPAQNLWEQLEFRAQSIAHELTVSMQGVIRMLPDPQLQDSGDRTATILTDIDPIDWETIEYTHQRPPRVYWTWGEGVVASIAYVTQSGLKINSVFCVAPGEAPGQGGEEQNIGEQLVTGQDELNAREGHRYAARANPEQSYFSVRLANPGDIGIDPSNMEWVRLTIEAAQAAQRGLTFTDERMLPFSVSIEHDHAARTKTQVIQIEREVVGLPATTYVPETGSTLPVTPDPDDLPWIDEDPADAGLFRGTETIGMFGNTGLFHYTDNFGTPEASNGPDWDSYDMTALSPALSGTFLAAVGDPFSPKYIGTGATVNAFILTSTGIYSLTDAFGVSGGPTLALQHTLDYEAEFGFIAKGIGDANWVVAGYYNEADGQGTRCVYTQNNGSTWTESVVSAHYDNSGGAAVSYHVPVFPSSASPGTVYIGAFTATQDEPPGGLYKSTNYGASFSAATDIAVTFGQLNGGTFQIPWANNPTQKIAYWTKSFTIAVSDTAIGLGRTEADGTTITDISPTVSGAQYGPRRWWHLSISATDRNKIALAGETKNGSGDFGVFVSSDAGDSWTQVTDTTDPRFEGIGIGGDDSNVIYAWGRDLSIWYSQDFGQTWEDKATKLSGTEDIYQIIPG